MGPYIIAQDDRPEFVRITMQVCRSSYDPAGNSVLSPTCFCVSVGESQQLRMTHLDGAGERLRPYNGWRAGIPSFSCCRDRCCYHRELHRKTRCSCDRKQPQRGVIVDATAEQDASSPLPAASALGDLAAQTRGQAGAAPGRHPVCVGRDEPQRFRLLRACPLGVQQSRCLAAALHGHPVSARLLGAPPGAEAGRPRFLQRSSACRPVHRPRRRCARTAHRHTG